MGEYSCQYSPYSVISCPKSRDDGTVDLLILGAIKKDVYVKNDNWRLKSFERSTSIAVTHITALLEYRHTSENFNANFHLSVFSVWAQEDHVHSSFIRTDLTGLL